MKIDRRTFTTLALGATILRSGHAIAAPGMLVHKDPTCGCCDAWVDHVRAAGYDTRVIEVPAINAIKARLGVPLDLRSCHTAEIDGYVLEGHVPAAAINRLLSERPQVRGLAAPGMPIGSPGMEVEGRDPEAYDVTAFGGRQPAVFMRFKGADPMR
ncbi:metal-binding protein [Methylopila jiangsuensis]|uniref:Metal-binding protein n=1 Tax=Methylopila jiangsuensis TaxID=586230 RepID=A0A9W6JI39_9HYPH|nr:hypothetical protein [Methylopila jiangsuensis]GLK77627.1 metal-binding protein [Methylopila jiangsuensis]